MSPATHGYQGTEGYAAPLFWNAGVSVALLAYFAGVFLRYSDVELDYWVAILIGGIMGAALQCAWYGLQIVRFRKPIGEHALVPILEAAAVRAGMERLPQVWIRNSERPILMSSNNPLFSAILVSDTAAEDIVRSPLMGEAVLAEKLLSLSSASRRSSIAFTVLTALCAGGFLFGTQGFRWLIPDMSPTFIVSTVVIALLMLIGIICLFVAAAKPRTGVVEDKVVQLYGMPAIVARAQVFGGMRIDEKKLNEDLADYPRSVEEEPRTDWKRNIKKSFIIALLAAVAYGAVLLVIVILSPPSILAVMAVVVVPPLFGAIVCLLSFFVLEFRIVRKMRKETDDDSNRII